MTTPTAPKPLSTAGKTLWRKILTDWNITDAAHLKVLEVGLLALDRAESLRKEIDRMGPAVVDRFDQTKANPLLPAERDSRSQFLTAIRSLGLDPLEV